MTRAPPSIVLSQVSRIRHSLSTIAVLRAVLWGASGFCMWWTLLELFQQGPLWHTSFLLIGVVAALTGTGIFLWRDRAVCSLQRVALWIEERQPGLKYALVTLIDPHTADAAMRLPLEAAVSQTQLLSHLRAAARNALLLPAGTLTVAIGLLALMPDVEHSRVVGSRLLQNPPVSNRLADLKATLVPPNYTGWPAQQLVRPRTLTGLVGSLVTITGLGPGTDIKAKLGTQELTANDRTDRWETVFTLPAAPMALTLVDRQYRKIIVLEPVADMPPVLTLRVPAADVTVQRAQGLLELDAELQDDVGVAQANFEYVVVSGESEGNFLFRSGKLDVRTFSDGARTQRLQVKVPYSLFKLQSGDQLSVRAVALDGNSLSGPGKGFSETRIIRVAGDKDEEKAEVNAAQPTFDPSLMSLRMLIIATETLDKSRATLLRPKFIEQAEPLAAQAKTVLQKIEGFVDEQRQGGAFEVPTLLTEALDAMRDGERAMAVAETGEALPPMRNAYAALRKLSNLERYYFRGQPPSVPVDIEGVRMTGTEPASAADRKARVALPRPGERFAERYTRAVHLLKQDPTEAVELLTLLRVDALTERPDVASALQHALAKIAAGESATQELLRTRAAIEGEAQVHATLPIWSPAQ